MATGTTSRPARVRSDAKLTNEEKAVLTKIRSGELDVAALTNADPPKKDDAPSLALGFILNPAQIASVEQGRGRKPVDPAYLKDMQEMIAKPGTYAGYRITAANPAPLIQSRIRRAARECDLETSEYSVYVREKEGFVSFTVHATVSDGASGS